MTMATLRRFLKRSTSLWARLKNGMAHKRIATLESQWQSFANARDTVFVTRVNSRYRAHRQSDSEVPLLAKTTHSTISPEAWEALYQPRNTALREAEVDIILPITHNYETVLPALYGLLTSNNDTPFRIVALLSQHPDHKLTDKLRRLQELDLFDLLVDSGEEGMAGLINFAMQRHDTRDIVLLSSHITCADGWIDRLRAASIRHPATTASVSPWLTTGGITGYPDHTGAFAHAFESIEQLDTISQSLFSGHAHILLAHPAEQALFIRREALHSIGLLPEKTRDIPSAITAWASIAHEKGFEHAWAQDVMLGTSSGYIPTIPPATTTNPAQSEAAQRIDKARFSKQAIGNTLIIEGIRTVRPQHESQGIPHLTPDAENPSLLRLGLPDARLFPHLNFPLDSAFEPLSELCEMLGITTLLLRQPAGFPSRFIEWLGLFSEQSGIPYQLDITDDYLICPGLLGVAKTCEPEDLESCYRSFTNSYPLDTDGMPLWLWRVRSSALLVRASALHFTDDGLKSLFQRYFSIR